MMGLSFKKLLLALARAVIFGSECCGTHDQILLSQTRDSSNLVKVKVKVSLRLAAYRQSVHLGVKLLETHEQMFFPTEPLR
jgi:hypothetical protein